MTYLLSFRTPLAVLGVAAGLCLSQATHAQSPCEGGVAGGMYPCQNIDMLAYMTKTSIGGGNMNDIWGWTDPLDGKEYVLACRTTGTSFIDISDPLNPVYLGNLPTHTVSSLWRDVKVHNNHAFVVSEAGNHGMQVFDLTRLRDVVNPPVTFTEDAHYGGFGSAHNVVINEESGRAYGVGTNTADGGLHIVDISDPLNPTILGFFAEDGYTHDAHVVNYQGPDPQHQGKEIAFAANENTVTIVDVTDPTDAMLVSATTYSTAQYTHQGWLTEDHRFFIVGDELDEYYGVVGGTTTYFWNVEDLDNPYLVGTHTSPLAAIDHNLYIRNNVAYQSNYRAGLRMLDLSDVANGTAEEMAYFDVYPSSNAAAFNGTWSNYPFFASGVVAVSHIEQGVFLLKPTVFNVVASATAFCSNEPPTLTVTGVTNLDALAIDGLPEGAVVDFTPSGTGAVAVLSGFPAVTATYNVLVGDGANTFALSLDVTDCDPNPGCTLMDACNYDPTATSDDGSCLYPYSAVYVDEDGDGVGGDLMVADACPPLPDDWVIEGGDCNDADATVYPGAPGTGEGVDNNCDGLVLADETVDCPADVTGDGAVSVADILAVLGEFGCLGTCEGDVDGDGAVTVADILDILSMFGATC